MALKICLMLLGDQEQFRTYKEFKADLLEEANGILNLEDLRDINNVGGDLRENTRNFIQSRHAIILVCSKRMKEVVERTQDATISLYGTMVTLHGDVLNGCFQNADTRRKVILVSFDDDNNAGMNERIPEMLLECPHFNINDDDVYDQVISSVQGLFP